MVKFNDMADADTENATFTVPRGVSTSIDADVRSRDGRGRMARRSQPSVNGLTPIKKRGIIQAGLAVHGWEYVPPPPPGHDSIVIVAFPIRIIPSHELSPSFTSVSKERATAAATSSVESNPSSTSPAAEYSPC
jgi:hypothetical protein